MKFFAFKFFALVLCAGTLQVTAQAFSAEKLLAEALAFTSGNRSESSSPRGTDSTATQPRKAFRTSGKVVYVDDGDTVVLLSNDNSQMKVRLASIDAPESSHTNKERGRIGQPYSDNSGKYLASLVKGKNVDANCFESDRYGRSVCELFVSGESVSQAMVRNGWAWANVSGKGRYLRDKSLPGLEAAAKASRSGLWAGANPVAPWEWRDLCWKQGQCAQ
jgi:micrococcal nuclease